MLVRVHPQQLMCGWFVLGCPLVLSVVGRYVSNDPTHVRGCSGASISSFRVEELVGARFATFSTEAYRRSQRSCILLCSLFLVIILEIMFLYLMRRDKTLASFNSANLIKFYIDSTRRPL
jgi:hypothetical protein